MTRAAGISGLLLGAVLLILGVLEIRNVGPASVIFWLVSALLVLLTAARTLGGSAGAQVVMSLLGLLLLARLLPIHFHSGLSWPVLAAIILASITFGLGILGILLDRYAAS